MTVAVALVDPPREGVACADIVEATAMSPADGVALYEAMLADFFTVTAEANVDLLVNYPTEDMLPEDGGNPEAEIREVAAQALDAEDLTEIRYEVQVGSTPSARIGNAITHLLRDEDESSAVFIDHRAPFLDRSVVDQAAINLRRSQTVVGPAADGGIYLAGFKEPIDFTDIFEGVPIENVVSRSVDDDLAVDFVRRREVVATPRDLKTVVSLLRARQMADKRVSTYTSAAVDELGLRVRDGDLVVEDSDNR